MSAHKLNVSVISPEKILYKGEVDSLVVPGSEGFFGILPNHAPLVATLGIGVLEIRKGEKLKKYLRRRRIYRSQRQHSEHSYRPRRFERRHRYRGRKKGFSRSRKVFSVRF